MSELKTNLEQEIFKRYRKVSKLEELWVRRRIRIMPFWELEKMIPKDGDLLDLGCGRGEFCCLLSLSSPKRKIVGVDLSKERLRTAKIACDGLENINFYKNDITRMKVKNADAVFLIEVLYLIPFKNQVAILESCAKMLKKRGLLLIKFFTLKEPHIFPKWKYLLTLFQTKVFHFTYKFLQIITRHSLFAQKILSSLLGKRTDGPHLWEEAKIKTFLEELGFEVKMINLRPNSLLPHPTFICIKK